MDEALGIMGVFLLELYNPCIVYQNPKDKRGVSRAPIGFYKADRTTGTPKIPLLSQLGQSNVQGTILNSVCCITATENESFRLTDVFLTRFDN